MDRYFLFGGVCELRVHAEIGCWFNAYFLPASGCQPTVAVEFLALLWFACHPNAEQTSQEVNPREDVQNLKEMQLVMLFQDLIRHGSASLTCTIDEPAQAATHSAYCSQKHETKEA